MAEDIQEFDSTKNSTVDKDNLNHFPKEEEVREAKSGGTRQRNPRETEDEELEKERKAATFHRVQPPTIER